MLSGGTSRSPTPARCRSTRPSADDGGDRFRIPRILRVRARVAGEDHEQHVVVDTVAHANRARIAGRDHTDPDGTADKRTGGDAQTGAARQALAGATPR